MENSRIRIVHNVTEDLNFQYLYNYIIEVKGQVSLCGKKFQTRCFVLSSERILIAYIPSQTN
jgi:hypothetical protein